MRPVVVAGPILLGSNLVLKRFQITIVFGNCEFDPRDVKQCRAGRPPATCCAASPRPAPTPAMPCS
jgi:hypothetical protein